MARILVVDDENTIRMMLRLALLHVGHTVETAADGYEGLAKFGDGVAWDLVLLDQRMPGMEGLEVLRQMREIAPAARIVMITAFGTIDLAGEALARGATNFLRKPFTIETLRGAVGAALAAAPTAPLVGDSPLPHTFDQMTVNGFRLRSAPGVCMESDGGISDTFVVTPAEGAEQTCRVALPAYLLELVKAHADRDHLPGGDMFWQALCGEALANYLWQNAETPPDALLRVEDLTAGLRHWIDGVLHTAG